MEEKETKIKRTIRTILNSRFFHFPVLFSSNRSNYRGFSLIELLVVIAIIAVLASSVVVLLDPVKQMKKSRDSRRKSEMKQIQTGLELYRADVGTYPADTSLASCGGSLSSGGTIYLKIIPCDPSGGAYKYSSVSPNQDYALYTCVENVSDFDAKNVCSGTEVPPACSPAITGCTKYFVVTSP